MANEYLVNLYQKNKNTFIVSILLSAIVWLGLEIIKEQKIISDKEKIISDKDKYIQEMEQKHTKFLTDWIDRHDSVKNNSIQNKNN